MIDYIRGKVAECSPAHAVIDVNGVGYFISIALSTYTALQGKEEACLYVHESIREDAYSLFGFLNSNERELFRYLISVSGIGANTGRMMMSAHSAAELQHAIVNDNINLLKGIKGIGLKTAQRIVVELKDKLGKLEIQDNLFVVSDNSVKEEALSALVMLGFAKAASQKVIDAILTQTPDAKVEAVIRKALGML
jgi:Holliday junction DNA helicase RuvA